MKKRITLTLEIGVEKCWVDDGFPMNPEGIASVLKSGLEHYLAYSRTDETEVRIIAADGRKSELIHAD